MGRIVRVIKSVYGKINWGIIKNALTSLLSIKMKIKENNLSKEYSCVIVVRCPNYKERYIYMT